MGASPLRTEPSAGADDGVGLVVVLKQGWGVSELIGKKSGSLGSGAMRGKALLPPTVLLISMVIMVGLRFVIPVMRIIPGPWNVLGIVPVALGVALNIIADNVFWRTGTTVKPFQESTALVTSGVYRISRHPMVLGYVLILVGGAVVLARLTPFLVIPVFSVLMDRVFISVEERMLDERFGQVWAGYKNRVRRWISVRWKGGEWYARV